MGKTLDHFLQPTVLHLLKEKEAHGFALIQKISETPMFANTYPDPSGLYRYLKKMEQQGLLGSREEVQPDFPSKKIYFVTEHGLKCLESWAETIKDYTKKLELLTAMISGEFEEDE